jgi:hypothetical protein
MTATNNVVTFPIAPPPTVTGMQALAMELAQLGYPVFPLRPGRKIPAVKRWREWATTDVFKILNEWPSDAHAPGIAMGRGLIAIDVEAAGLQTDVALLQLPNGPNTETGRAGGHWIFRTPDGALFGNSQKAIAPNTDVKAEGGLIVAPGGYADDPKTGVRGWYKRLSLARAADMPALPARLSERMREAPVKAANAGQVLGDLDTQHALQRAAEYLADTSGKGPPRGVLPGGRGTAAYRVAARLGDFGISMTTAYELMLPWNASACVPPQDDDEFAKCVEHAYQYRQDAIGRDNATAHFSPAPYAPLVTPAASAPTWKDRVISASVLGAKQFTPVRWLMSGLIPEGLTLLAGKPKLGKSWLALDACIAVATGGTCLGATAIQGDVLYLALEDNQRRLQRRMQKLCSASWPANLTLATEWPRVDQGGLADMAAWADSVQRPVLIVCDTLAKVKPLSKTRGYDEDYLALSELQRFSGARGIPILVIHHERKMAADDPLDRVSGTLGLTGAADSVVSIARSNKGVTFYIRGRDVEETEKAIEFDAAACRWRMLGNASEIQRTNERKLIVDALKHTKLAGPKLLAELTGISHANVKQLVLRMTEAGELIRPALGTYALPDPL